MCNFDILDGRTSSA